MVNEDIEKFAEFLDYYKNKYGKPSWEISLPHSRNKNTINPQPLVTSNYIMLDFDEMCKDANFYPKKTKKDYNRPSTVDGIYYRIIHDNKIELSLFEFKSFYFDWDTNKDYEASLNKIKNKLKKCGFDNNSQQGLNRLEKIKNTIGSTIEFSLRLKPYETLFVVLPKLYEEYCDKNNIPESDRIDLYNLFKSDMFTIKLFVVGKTNKQNKNKAYMGKLANILNKQYKRLDFVNVLTPHPQRLCFEWEFDKYASNLQLNEHKNIKSLNFEG